MAVKIRLKPMGSRNNAFYRIVVADERKKLKGKAIEYIGYYNPNTEAGTAVLKHDRYQHWIGVGAIPSDTVRSLAKRAVEHATTLPVPETAEEAAAQEEEVATEAAPAE